MSSINISLFWIIEILINALAIGIFAFVMPFVRTEKFTVALLAGLVIALVNSQSDLFLQLLEIERGPGSWGLMSFVVILISIMLFDVVSKPFKIRSFFATAVFALILVFLYFGLNVFHRVFVSQFFVA